MLKIKHVDGKEGGSCDAWLFSPLAWRLWFFWPGARKPDTRSTFDIARDGTPQAVKTAIDRAKGTDGNTREYTQGKTLLMWAAQFNSNPEVTAVILKSGADLEARDYDSSAYGWTALMWAADSSKNPEVITTLVKAGADVKAKDKEGFTPLLIAAENNENAAVVARVASVGSDLEAKDNNGYTALIQAASKNHNPDVVVALLSAGANAKVKNAKGYTALDYAKVNQYLKNTDAFKKLEEASR